MANETLIHKPSMVVSDEANAQQLQLARAQGQAYVEALKEMSQEEAHSGGEKAAGGYLVAYAIEHAEGMYMMQGGELVWYNPREENCHIEISVRDAADNRFIPGLTVRVTLLDGDTEIGTHEMPFIWHPWLYHYGRNWIVPRDGSYTLKVTIEPPMFMRHDKRNGLRYVNQVEVEFEDVEIETGQKIS